MALYCCISINIGGERMKKSLISILALMLAMGTVSPSLASAAKGDNVFVDPGNQLVQVEQDTLIQEVEQYVVVLEDGTISLKDVPFEIYEKYNLALLEERFADLNSRVTTGEISISQDLNITSNIVQANAVYGEWTEHWWGFDRNFTNSQANDFAIYCLTVAGGGAIIGGVGAYFPPVAAIAGVTGGYFALLSARVYDNNKGNGVYIGVTWVAVFNVSPL